MSGRTPSPRRVRSPAAKSAPMKRVRQAPRRRTRSNRASAAGSRSMQISVPSGPSRIGDQARVAAAAEGAVDRGLPRLGRQQRDQLGGEDGFVLGRHIDKGCARRLPGVAVGVEIVLAAHGLACHAALRSRPGPRRSPAPRRRAPPPAWPRPRRSRSPGTRRRRSRRRGRRGRRARSAAWGCGCGPAESSFSSKEPPWKRRRRLRASLPKGLCGERKRSESCSNSAVVCTQTQGSKPLERTTPSESAARNRDGTVRRSLESRLCS